MKILVVEENAEMRELIEFTLESQLFAITNCVSLPALAIKVLETDPLFDGIIYDDTNPSEDIKALREFVSYLEKPIAFVSSSNRTDLLHSLQQQMVQLKQKLTLNSPIPQYCRVRARIALRFGLLKCDLFVKINEQKYVKVMREGDLFDLLDLNRFESKKVDFFYILSSDADKVIGRLNDEFTKLCQSEELPFESHIQVSTTTLEMISDFTHSCGFSPEVQKLTKLSVNLALKTIQKNPSLKDLYALMIVQSDRYLVSHSVLLAHVACGISSLLGWGSESTFYKLSLAAFMHDMTLNNDELSKIHDLSELEAHGAQFTDEQKLCFKEHPEKAGDWISSISEIPPDVHVIVREHHELPDGTGFPRGLNSAKISPLGAVFILSENLIHFQTQICVNPDLSVYIENLSPSFSKGQFKDITNALILSMIDNELKT